MATLPTSHPDLRDLTAFAEARLTPEETARVAAHLDGCPRCRALVEQQRHAGPAVASALAATAIPETSAGRPAPAIMVPPEIPPELANHPRYRIVRVLGQGGMGTVYLAEHKVMKRQVALKVINRVLLADADMLQRFLSEVQAASRLAHVNIVAAYDAEEAGTLHFLAMEYVEGVSLAEYLKKKGPLPIRLACNLARQVAEGLQHAHDQGMVHRDIKPGNLMLMRSGRVKILDFGLVRLRTNVVPGKGLTQTGSSMGTPEYMPPEQARDASRADRRADIYSLGATLYCLLAGRPPFVEANALDVMLAHVTKVPEPLHRLRPEIPEGLSAVVARMLAKEPGQRYQTAEQVKQALTPFCRKEGPSVPPPLPWQVAGDDLSVGSLPGPEAEAPNGEPASGMNQSELTVAEQRAAPVSRWVVVLAMGLVALVPLTGYLLSGGARRGKPTERATFVNTIGMTMARLADGTFTMGSPRDEEGHEDNEEQHPVEVSEFYLGVHEVTQKQFREVMGYNPSFFSKNASKNARGKEVNYRDEPGGGKAKIPLGDDPEDYPVENVSWDEAVAFCRQLTEMDKKKPGGWVYRLPREAEWEYACRAGAPSSQPFPFGKSLSALQANFDGKGVSLERTRKVGAAEKNAFGLFDMHGNVWEWCADWYDKAYYRSSPLKDPPGPLRGSERVNRGGSWWSRDLRCRSAYRNWYEPAIRYNHLGFRAALVRSERAQVME
jgi:formylglycine-generating enzyme required for sulfatase activity/tRNA A-37 threonylcarbamoyl transferase component Bud32